MKQRPSGSGETTEYTGPEPLPRIRIACRFEKGEQFLELAKANFVIGRRSQQCDPDVNLDFDVRVSRLHARISLENGCYWIEDLGSKFGTLVDGVEIKGQGKQRLSLGTAIRVGDTLLRVDSLPASPSPPSATCKKGRYSLVRLLGKGAAGSVWLAHDHLLGENVALRFLGAPFDRQSHALDLLREQLLICRTLTHPNIIRIHDLHEEPGQEPFICMEFVEGPNFEIARQNEPLHRFNWLFLAPFVRQICLALDYAHSEQVACTNLTPSNLMMDAKGRLKLAEFGFGSLIGSHFQSQIGLASRHLQYLSPQIIAGALPSQSDDFYALGATLYELLTGTPPFVEGALVHQITNTQPEPIQERLIKRKIKNDIPKHIVALIMACLAKSPENRPPSARAIAAWIG